MKENEKAGVWMDHSQARIIPYSQERKNWLTIDRANDRPDHELFGGQEKHIRNKSRRQQLDFYRAVMKAVGNCRELLLFGPTEAKQELYNLIRENPHNDRIKIVVKNAPKMSDNEAHAYVMKHFRPIFLNL